jgi:molybdopterin synthase sulfur carrier subunit
VRVEVRAFATLRPFLPRGNRQAALLDLPDGSTIRDLVRALGVPDAMTVIALLNGREAKPDQPLRGNDVVTLFPPLAGGRRASGTLRRPLEASRNPVGLPDFKSGVRL